MSDNKENNKINFANKRRTIAKGFSTDNVPLAHSEPTVREVVPKIDLAKIAAEELLAMEAEDEQYVEEEITYEVVI